MKRIRKYGGIFIGGLIFTILLLWCLNYFTERKIKSFLDRKVDEGMLQYESFTFHILSNKGTLQSPVILVQNESTTKIIKANRMSMADFSVYQYLINGTININEIDIINPQLRISPNLSNNVPSHHHSQKQKISHNIQINTLNIIDGTIQYFTKDSSRHTLFCNISEIRIENLLFDTTGSHHPLPFSYDDLSITGDSLIYRLGELYELQVAHFSSKNDQIVMETMHIKPRYEKQEFEVHIPFEKTQVDLKIPRIVMDRHQLKLSNDTFLIAASKLTLDTAKLHLYRNKTLPDNRKFIPLYSKVFRELPFLIDIDTVSIVDADITYELKVKSDRSPGLVFVNALNADISNLTNVGMYKDDFPKTKISADAILMKETPVHLDWTFDIDNKIDEFHVSGRMSRITQKGINYFISPILDASVEGAIDHFAFNFAGNDNNAKGDAYIQYDTLRINILKPHGHDKKPIFSAIVNLFIKNKLNGSTEVKGMEVKRDKTKSFWSFLWEMMKEGTLKSIM